MAKFEENITPIKGTCFVYSGSTLRCRLSQSPTLFISGSGSRPAWLCAREKF